MSKRNLILVTTAILIIAVGVFALVSRPDTHKSSQTANAPIATGLSLLFDAPLTTELVATIKDNTGTTFKTVTLEPNASRFNLDMPSGIYQVAITAKDNSIPPLTPETITITDGVLSELHLTTPHAEEE